jgi:hypothetical protein
VKITTEALKLGRDRNEVGKIQLIGRVPPTRTLTTNAAVCREKLVEIPSTIIVPF